MGRAEVSRATVHRVRAGCQVKYFEGIDVTGFELKDGAVAGVKTSAGPPPTHTHPPRSHPCRTDAPRSIMATKLPAPPPLPRKGDIECDHVVNCAGQWARQLGALAGVTVPLHSAEHYYLTTAAIEGINHNTPVMRDPDSYNYYRPPRPNTRKPPPLQSPPPPHEPTRPLRIVPHSIGSSRVGERGADEAAGVSSGEWSGGLMIGGFEPVCKPVFSEGAPRDFA